MSEPFVSSFDEKFIAAFGRGIENLPEYQTKLVKDIVDKILTDVILMVESHIEEDMKRNMHEEIRSEAAKVAQSMLANAIAGNDKEIRNLFGFNEWYMKSAYVGDGPTQWKLIDALVARSPDIFVNEKILQQDKKIELLKYENIRLKASIQYMKDNP